ncbi:MAG: ABC transporter permease [Miniphocaeibacter sp.]|uniref:ABC transporter permease n=1 Tax=Miniphocaeibacter sp. TaxID=3100973 RepID=UPI0017987732|nr:ABC transporter permease [Gallicola sp.]
MNTIYFIVQQMMFFSIPLLIVALGGMFSERSGIINIGLEGTMILGAFAGILFINRFQDKIPGQPVLILAIIIASLTGMLVGLLHAFASINLKADQVISGTAINMFAVAFATYVARTVNTVQQIPFKNQFHIKSIPLLGKIPIIGPMFFQNTYFTTYLGLAILIISIIVLYNTKFGLRLTSCGEHPQAADSMGINVYKMRYAGVVISGILAAIGGLVFIIPTSTSFNASVSGYGFLAMAVLIFGQWRPKRIFVAALFFGLMKTLSATYSGIAILRELPISNTIYKMIPFIATLIVLAFTSKKSQSPKALGKIYDKSLR